VHKPVEANCTRVDEASDAIYGVIGRDLYKPIPVAKYLEQRDFNGTEPFIAAFRTRGATDEVDGARIAWRSPGQCDRLPTLHLR
jgi:hypothetical protein